MVRNYQRKIEIDKSAINSAISDVVENRLSIRRAAHKFNLKVSTLQYHLKNWKDGKNKGKQNKYSTTIPNIKTKNFALIPDEMINKHTVSQQRLSELDKTMKNTLKDSTLTNHEKVIHYHNLLNTSLNLQKFNSPIKNQSKEKQELSKETPIKIEEDPRIENHKVPEKVSQETSQDNLDELILSSASKHMRGKAENILNLIKKQPDVLSWKRNGQLVLHGEKISNSNIIDFFEYLLNSRKSMNSDYDVVLRNLNIPINFIGNKKLLNSPIKKKTLPKRKVKNVKLPFKWEDF